MSCFDENTALALVMGELTSEQAKDAQVHLASCEPCRKLTSVLAAASGLDGLAATVNSPPTRDTIASMSSPTVADGGNERFNPRRSGGGALTRIGRYEVSKHLGAGGMGAVFLADDLELHRKVAIKLMHTSTPQASERMLQEARSMAKLRHPNVVTVYDVGRDGDDVYVAMEYIAGTTLRKWLQSDPPIAKRVEVIAEAGKGLMAAHDKGLVHRDFKPDNVMVGDDGRVQVLDFGLAKAGDQTIEAQEPGGKRASPDLSLTRTGSLVGTPAYMAPEQFEMGATDARTDQFAFCTVLFEALFGERPFLGDTLEELADSVSSGVVREVPSNPAVSSTVAAAIARGLAAAPGDRFESMGPLLEVLDENARPSRTKVRQKLAIASLGLVAVGVLAGVVLLRGDRKIEPEPFAAILANSELPERRAEPLANDPFEVTVHRLTNGLTVFMSPNHQRPLIAAQMVVRAGSRDDPDNQSGVAHLAERMMFHGTEALGTTDYESERKVLAKLRLAAVELAGKMDSGARERQLSLIDELSVAASEFALPDEFVELSRAIGASKVRSQLGPRATVFSAELPSERFSQWALLEGERWSRPVTRLFQHELAEVIGERRQKLSAGGAPDDPGALVVGDIFAEHLYGRNPNGEFADLAVEMLPHVETFLAERYIPNNSALILVGDIDVAAAIPILERAFSKWQPRPLARHPHHVPTKLSTTVKTKRLSNRPRYAAFLGRESAEFRPRDAVKVVLSRLLKAPELFASPKTLRGVVDVRFVINRDRGTPSWSLLVQPEPNQPLSDSLAIVERRLAAIEAGEYEPRHVDGILERFRLRMVALSAESSVRANPISEAYAGGGSWPLSYQYRATDKVTVDEVAELAGQLRRNGRIALQVEQGDVALPLAKTRPLPALLAAPRNGKKQSSFATKVLATEIAERPMRFFWPGRDYNIRQTAAGELITVQSKSDEIFEAVLRWGVGWRTLPALCLGLWSLDDVGLGKDSAEAKKRRWSRELFTAQITCGRETSSLRMRGPTKHFSNVASVLELLRGEQLTDAILTNVAERHIGRKPDEIAADHSDALNEYALTGDQSVYLTMPSGKQLRGTSASAVKKALDQLLRTKRTTLFFGKDTTAMNPFVDLGKPLSEPIPRPPASIVQPPGRRFVLFDSGGGRDIKVTAYSLLRRLPSDQVSAFEVYQVIAAERLRAAFATVNGEVASFGWTIGRVVDGAIYNISFSPNANEILSQIELADAAMAPVVNEKELELARVRVEADYRSQWISQLNLTEAIASWREHGHDGDPRPARFAALKQLSASEVQAISRIIASAPRVFVIFGDLSKLDRDALRLVGKIDEVQTIDLYSK